MSDVESVVVDSVPEGADSVEGQAPAVAQGDEEALEVAKAIAPDEQQPEAEVSEETDQTKLKTLQAELEQVQAQAAEYLDGWQRARAEFANYKKRVGNEREDLRRASNETLLLKLLPVVDDFQRAFQTLPEDLNGIPWVEGMAMVLRKLKTLLESEGVMPVEAAGQPFDPSWHQAVMKEETTEHPDGYVIEEMQPGYRLGERVLRPAMVKVASNAARVTSDEEDESSE